MAAFPLAFAKKMFGLNLKSANTKTAGANKVLKVERENTILQLTSVDKTSNNITQFFIKMNESKDWISA